MKSNIARYVFPIAVFAAVWTIYGCTNDNPSDGDRPDDGGVNKGEEFTYISVKYKKKPTSDWSDELSGQTLTVSNMNRLKTAAANETDEWGGCPDKRPTAVVSKNTAGFWHTGKVGDRWVMVNPAGNVSVLHGMNGVSPDASRDGTTEQTQTNYNLLFGSVDKWADYASNLLSDYAFDFFSANIRRIAYYWDYFTDETTDRLRSPANGAKLSQTEHLYLLRTFSWDYYANYKVSFSTDETSIFTLMFDPLYLDYIDKLAEEGTAPFLGSKNLIGWYIDNELDFSGIKIRSFLALTDKFEGQFEGARKFARDFMTERFGVEPVAANITTEINTAFRAEVARYYYRTATEAIRRHDPNHLILGSRLHSSSKKNQYVVAACAEYCDVVSINYYQFWEPQKDYFLDQVKVWSGDSPFMITEFYVKADNADYSGTPYENAEGGGWIVEDQKARGYFYQNFCIRLLELGNCVGWQWFEFMDNYGTSLSSQPDKTGSNKGIVNAKFEPYYDCLDLMCELNWNIYRIMDYFDTEKPAVE